MNRRQGESALRGMVKVAGWLVVVIAIYLGAKLYQDGQFREDSDKRSAAATAQRDQQSQDLACFADATTRWQVAISDVITVNLANPNSTSPQRAERAAALQRLVEVNRELQSTKALCPGIEQRPVPLPPSTSGSGTTTTAPPG